MNPLSMMAANEAARIRRMLDLPDTAPTPKRCELLDELARLRDEHGDDAYFRALHAACRLQKLEGDRCLSGMPDSWLAEAIARMRGGAA